MQTFYDLLGVPADASQQEIYRAYRKKVMEYHPDRVASLGPKLQAVAEKEMRWINRAWEILKDHVARRRYDEQLQAGGYQSADHDCGEASADSPASERDAIRFYKEGIGYGRIGRHEDAVEALKRAIHIKPDYSEAYCDLAKEYNALKRYEEAAEACKRAILITPELADAHYLLGHAYHHMDRHEEAIKLLKQAIQLRPDFADAYYTLGRTYYFLDRYQDAIDACKQAILICPNLEDAYDTLDSVYDNLESYEDLVDIRKLLVQLKPNCRFSQMWLADAYRLLADQMAKTLHEEAVAHQSLPLIKSEEDCMFLISLAQLLSNLRNNSEVLSICEAMEKSGAQEGAKWLREFLI